MKKKTILILMMVLALTLTACGGKKEAVEGEKTLRVALSDDATSLDPDDFNDDYSENMMIQVYDTLIEKKEDGSLMNSLAESVENSDPQSYKITLREGVKFSNGEDLTVDDVIFSLTRAANSAKYSYIFGNIDLDSFQVEGNQLSFHLKEPDASFMEALSHPGASILSKAYVEDQSHDLSTQPMGTGAFKLDSWTKNSEAIFSVNEHYWGEKPAIDRIEMRVIPESSLRLTELESGGVDLAYKIAPNDKAKIEENEDLQLFSTMDNSTHFIGFNESKPPFDNKLVREAITYGVDMKTIFDSVYMGSGSLASSPINPNFKYSLAGELEPIAQDVEKAKQLLQEAGVEEGTTLTIYLNDNQQRVDVATMMQAQLKELGIDLQIQKLEWGAMIEALKNKEHNMFIMSWTPSVVDAHYELAQPFSSSNKGEGPNYMFFGNDRMDQLIDEGISTIDEQKRAEIYGEAQRLINEEKPWLYICYGETLVGAGKDVQGFNIEPKYAQHLKDVSIDN